MLFFVGVLFEEITYKKHAQMSNILTASPSASPTSKDAGGLNNRRKRRAFVLGRVEVGGSSKETPGAGKPAALAGGSIITLEQKRFGKDPVRPPPRRRVCRIGETVEFGRFPSG